MLLLQVELTTATNCEILKLQRVQNAAVRLLNSACKYRHITPILKELDPLPVRFRIHFKILLLTFKALNGSVPDYVTELINVRRHRRYLLRSNSGIIISHPVSRRKKQLLAQFCIFSLI